MTASEAMAAAGARSDWAVHISGLRHRWPGAPHDLLNIGEWGVRPAQRVLVLGASGSGKSTLLSLLAGVHVPLDGQVKLLGQDWAGLSAARRDTRRADHVGYIFQQFNLLPYLPVVDNVTLPCGFSARRRQRAGDVQASAQALLGHLGLPESCWRRPAADLSVGQQQRVAAARALIGAPEVLIADEPTSALDDDTRDQYMQVLLQSCVQSGAALIFVSHDRRLATHFDQVWTLESGTLRAWSCA